MLEKQEIHCHGCDRWVQFSLDTSVDGNHVLRCPVCGHEHCRVVRNGRITDIRWDRRNGITIPVSATGTTVASVYTSGSASTYTTAYWHGTNTSSGAW